MDGWVGYCEVIKFIRLFKANIKVLLKVPTLNVVVGINNSRSVSCLHSEKDSRGRAKLKNG